MKHPIKNQSSPKPSQLHKGTFVLKGIRFDTLVLEFIRDVQTYTTYNIVSDKRQYALISGKEILYIVYSSP